MIFSHVLYQLSYLARCLKTRTEQKNEYNTGVLEATTPGLDRFIRAQEATYGRALAELRDGQKQSHWMWFIFPQLRGLGRSEMSDFYGIAGVEEADAYLEHPVLGPRLIECTQAVLAVQGRSARDIFGTPDDLKLRSSATLFAARSAGGSVFHQVLETYFGGQRDEVTLGLMRHGGR